MSIEDLVRKIRELATSVKVCLEENISEAEKITILLLALPEEYASEALKIENQEHEHLEDALPMLLATEMTISARDRLPNRSPRNNKPRDHSTEECNDAPVNKDKYVKCSGQPPIKYYTISNVGMGGNSKDQWIIFVPYNEQSSALWF